MFGSLFRCDTLSGFLVEVKAEEMQRVKVFDQSFRFKNILFAYNDKHSALRYVLKYRKD